MTFFQNFLLFIGRLCFAFIFFLAGIDKVFQFNLLLAPLVTAKFPFAETGLIIMLLLELIAGILMFLGWKTRFGALLALISIGLVQCLFHSYWQLDVGMVVKAQGLIWMNLALFGGGLMLLAVGPGKISLDGFLAPN